MNIESSFKPNLCLGTAQFGLSYGISNDVGQIQPSVVSELLKCAAASKISYLDTAQAYGNAQYVLGITTPSPSSFKIISKLKPQDKLKFSKFDFANSPMVILYVWLRCSDQHFS